MDTIAELISRHARTGRVEWIGLRPAKRTDLISVSSAEITDCGLEGDHRSTPGKRAVSLIQAEHITTIASLLGQEGVAPELLRRNIVVSGINLLGLRNHKFSIGSAVLEGMGICAPCSRMEEIFGHGGYSAVRGHGGIVASVVQPGTVSLNDDVTPL